MPHTLQCRSLRFARQHTPFLLRLAQIQLQHDEHRQRDARQDDGERAEAPAPPDTLVESLARLGTRKCNDDVRRAGKCEGETSIAEARRIGRDHIDRVYYAGEPDRIEDLGGAEDGEGAGARHEHEAERCECDHQGETLGATPEVEDLGHGNVCCGRHAGGDYGDDGEEGVFFPFAGDVRGEVAEDGGLEAIDEVEKPHTISRVRHDDTDIFNGLEAHLMKIQMSDALDHVSVMPSTMRTPR